MKKNYRWLIVILILALGFGLVLWSPWSARQERVDFDNAQEILKASRKKLDNIDNYTYKTDAGIGENIEISVKTRVVMPDKQMAALTWNIYKSSGSATMYKEADKIYVFDESRNKWVKPSDEPRLALIVDFFKDQFNLIDPVISLSKVDLNSKSISLVKNENNDKPNDSVVKVVPKDNSFNELIKSLPPQLSGAELVNTSQYFWVSKEDLMLTRYEVRAKVSFFGLKTMNFKVVSVPEAFNNTEIEVPKI